MSSRYRGTASCILQMTIPVPDDVRKRKTKLDLDKAGERMQLSFTNMPEIDTLEGKFKGLISPLDSVWMLGKSIQPDGYCRQGCMVL